MVEELPVVSLVEDALRMNLGGMERHGVQVVREYAQVPAIQVDKHKVLQILVNLIRNAKYACDEGRQGNKRIILRVGLNGGNRVKISVIDNGVGIPFLLAYREAGLDVVAFDGPGQGAAFTLELPLQPAPSERN